VRRVTRALFTVAPQFISWPSNDEAQIIMRKFEEASRFPNTIGAMYFAPEVHYHMTNFLTNSNKLLPQHAAYEKTSL